MFYSLLCFYLFFVLLSSFFFFFSLGFFVFEGMRMAVWVLVFMFAFPILCITKSSIAASFHFLFKKISLIFRSCISKLEFESTTDEMEDGKREKGTHIETKWKIELTKWIRNKIHMKRYYMELRWHFYFNINNCCQYKLCVMHAYVQHRLCFLFDLTFFLLLFSFGSLYSTSPSPCVPFSCTIVRYLLLFC